MIPHKLFAFALMASACFGQQTTGNAYDVRLNYNASANGYTTTTGTISASSKSLSVASAAGWNVGNGILVTGGCASGCTAQASGTFLWTYVTAISGTTLTLNDAAGALVTGGRVAHDETRAINQARADAFNHGGGEVYLSIDPTTNNCVYKVSGPLNSTTNSILTMPQNLTYVDPVTVAMLGQIKGATSNGTSITGGCGMDATDAPAGSGTNPAFDAVAPYVVTSSGNFTAVFQAVDIQLSKLLVILPNQTTLNGFMWNNAMKANLGAGWGVITSGATAAPTGSTTGVRLPGWLNNVNISVGPGQVSGFNVCMSPGEHAILNGPYLVNCNVGMTFFKAHDQISGTVRIEQCPLMWAVDSSVADEIPINLNADNETTLTGKWYDRGTNDLVDNNSGTSWLYGKLTYKIKSNTEVYETINKSGGSNLVYCNGGAAPTLGVCTP